MTNGLFTTGAARGCNGCVCDCATTLPVPAVDVVLEERKLTERRGLTPMATPPSPPPLPLLLVVVVRGSASFSPHGEEDAGVVVAAAVESGVVRRNAEAEEETVALMYRRRSAAGWCTLQKRRPSRPGRVKVAVVISASQASQRAQLWLVSVVVIVSSGCLGVVTW